MEVHSPAAPDADEVDEIVEFWRRENPALDPTTKTLSLRLRRAAHLFERAMRRELAARDVELWELEMLMPLRRAPGMQSSAGALARESHVTSGAITNRLCRLEDHGWIRRDADPTDRRQVLVTLTPAGRTRADELIAVKTETEQRFFAGMARPTLERMTTDLRDLLASVEEQAPADDAAIAGEATPEPGCDAATSPRRTRSHG